MTTSTTTRKTKAKTIYTVVPTYTGQYIVSTLTRTRYDYLRNKAGWIRIFSTRNSARKRISRERFGDFHN